MTLTPGTRRLFGLLGVVVVGIVAYDVGVVRRRDDPAERPALPAVLDVASDVRRGLDETPLLYPAEYLRDLANRRRDLLVAAQPVDGPGSAGFLIGSRGDVLIAHTSTSSDWRVITGGGQVHPATLTAYDAVHGVALLGAPELALVGELEMIAPGDVGPATPLVGVLPTPAGVTVRTLTAPGTVPALIDRLSDADLEAGEIVLDLDGRLVAFRGSVDSTPLLPVEVQEIAAALSTDGRHLHPWIGADVQTVDPALAALVGEGRLVVVHVDEGSPAARAGLSAGMVFAEVVADEGRARTADQLRVLMRTSPRLRFVPVTGDEASIEVDVADRQVPPGFEGPHGVARPPAGQPLTILAGSHAALSGLRSGDVVVAVDSDRAIAPDDIEALLTAPEPHLVTVRRGARRLFVVFPPRAPEQVPEATEGDAGAAAGEDPAQAPAGAPPR